MPSSLKRSDGSIVLTAPFPFLVDLQRIEAHATHDDLRHVPCAIAHVLAWQEGLTKTYNRLHDPKETDADMVRLRELHVAMNRAVAADYGWDDLGHGLHQTKQGLRFIISEEARREVLGR